MKLPALDHASLASLSPVGLLADARVTATPLAGCVNDEHAVGSIFTTLGAIDALNRSDDAKDKIRLGNVQRLVGMHAYR